MKSLLPGEIKGYAVRKPARELKVGDTAFYNNHVYAIEEIKYLKSRDTNFSDSLDILSTDGRQTNIPAYALLNCIQKEDPAIQLAIEAKLEVLRKHKAISASSNNHVLIKDGVPLTTSGEWIKQGSPHQWFIVETEGEYEYWEDGAYEMRVLWRGNKIIAWNNGKKKPLSMYMLASKEGVCVFDKITYDLPKFIWR